jgi:hypothetical protein
MTPAESQLIEHALSRLQPLGASLQLVPDDYVDDEGSNLGEWDEAEMTLRVAMDHRDWAQILAHEIGHVEQTLRGDFCDSQHWDTFQGWLGGLRVSARRLLTAVRYIQRCELDAERSGLRLVKALGLGDADLYISRANAYLWKYEMARRLGRWPDIIGSGIVGPRRLITMQQLGKVPPEIESLMASD